MTKQFLKKKKITENENFQNSNAIACIQFFETSRTFETKLRRNKIK